MSPLHRRRTAESIVFALLFSTSLLSAARADEPGFQSIFNGKDLTGWRLGNAELAGKTASDDGRFAVKDGVLVITGSKDTPPRMAEIDTVESYDGDFTLRLEFRASRDANSGLHLRDKAFAHQLQIRDYPRVGPYKALKGYKDGDWNAIEVIVTGTRARCTCNGELLEAALAIPDNGPLALQSEINVVEYRNIRIKREERGPRGQTRHPLCRPAARAPGARCLFAAGREGPAGGLLDPRRRLAGRRQVERPDQAAGVHGQGVRLRLHQLPTPAARRDGDHRARHRQVDPLGARPHRRVRGRPAASPRHGPFRRRAARRAGLHRRSIPEGRGAVPGDHQGLRARRRGHLRRAGHHRDGGDPSAGPRPAAGEVSATARSSATTRRSIATSPP